MSANEAVLRVWVLFMVSPLGTTMIAGLIDNKLNVGMQRHHQARRAVEGDLQFHGTPGITLLITSTRTPRGGLTPSAQRMRRVNIIFEMYVK
jgi:hypothetical protein